MRVDFYHLVKNKNRDMFLYKLLTKALSQKNEILVHLGSQQEAEELDTQLWVLDDEAFLPHSILDDSYEEAPIQLHYAGPLPEEAHRDVLICLSDKIPDFYKDFKRVIHVSMLPETLVPHRKFYQAQAAEMYEHEI